MFKSPEDDSTFHAVFSTGRTGLTGSAVCSFRLQDLERTFDEGKFREQVGQNKRRLLDYFSLICVLGFLGGEIKYLYLPVYSLNWPICHFGNEVTIHSSPTERYLIHLSFSFSQATSTSVWLPVPSARVPQPRPGSCVPDTRTLPDTVLNFIRKHPLMDGDVPHEAGEGGPVFYRRGVQFTRLAVDR